MSLFGNPDLQQARNIFAAEIYEKRLSIPCGFDAWNHQFSSLIKDHQSGTTIFKGDASASATLQKIADLTVLTGQLKGGFISKLDEWSAIRNSSGEPTAKAVMDKSLPPEIPAEFFVAADALLEDPEAVKAKFVQVMEALSDKGKRNISGNGFNPSYESSLRQFQESIERTVTFLTTHQKEYQLLKSAAAADIEVYHAAMKAGYDPVMHHANMTETPYDTLYRLGQKKQAAERQRVAEEKAEAELAAAEVSRQAEVAQAEKLALEQAKHEQIAAIIDPKSLLEEAKQRPGLTLPPQIEELGPEKVAQLNALREELMLTQLTYAVKPAVERIVVGDAEFAVGMKEKALQRFYEANLPKSEQVNNFNRDIQRIDANVAHTLGNANTRISKIISR